MKNPLENCHNQYIVTPFLESNFPLYFFLTVVNRIFILIQLGFSRNAINSRWAVCFDFTYRIIGTPKIPMSETVLWKVWSSILPWCPIMQKDRVSIYRKVVQKHLITLWYWWKIGHLPKIFIPATLENFFVLHYGHHLRVNNLWDFRNKELWISPYPYPSRERNQDLNLE